MNYPFFYKIVTLAVIMQVSAMTWATENASGCGNKHDNLVKLQTILKQYGTVSVPPFIGISSSRVEAFLNRHNPSLLKEFNQVKKELKSVLSNAPAPVRERPAWLTRMKDKLACFFPTWIQHSNLSVENKLKKIQEAIIRCFSQHSFPFTQAEAIFFAAVSADGYMPYLMVRSSGIEDGATVVNAGGNESIAYVSPRNEAIKTAMGRVIASYFSLHSISSWILKEDENQQTLCIPVLMQKMIGEKVTGTQNVEDIPVSGVAFTTQRAYSSDKFTVTEINVTYGHGEGVVASKAPVDKYYVGKHSDQASFQVVFSVIADKHQRVAPHHNNGQNGTLAIQANPDSIRYAQTVSLDTLCRLYHALKDIETAYSCPMDVEFVVLKGRIYIVQARPAVSKPCNPTYTNARIGELLDSTNAMNILVSATNSALVITDAADVLISNTLDDADMDARSKNVKAVVVKEWASPLSHAAVNFSSYGTPCFQTHDIETIKAKLHTVSPHCPLIIDTQKKIFYWLNKPMPQDQTMIITGWYEHPLERVISLPRANPVVLTAHANPIPQDGKLVSILQACKQDAAPAIIKQSINDLKEYLKKSNAFIDSQLQQRVFKNVTQLLNAFASMKGSIDELIDCMQKCVDRGYDRISFLFYHKMLEALILQDITGQRIVNGYNYFYFLNEVVAQKQLSLSLKRQKITVFQDEYAYKTYACCKEAQDAWQVFVIAMDRNPYLTNKADMAASSLVNDFRQVLESMTTFDVLSMWMATELYTFTNSVLASSASDSPVQDDTLQDYIKSVVASYDKKFFDRLGAIDEKNKALVTFLNRFAQCSKMNDIEKQWRMMHDTFIESCTNPSFIQQFQAASRLEKIVISLYMHNLVDAIDRSIKMVKTNPSLSFSDKQHLFKKMVADFNTLVHTWALDLLQPGVLSYHSSYPLKSYLEMVSKRMNDIMAKKITDAHDIFVKSETFAVQAAMLGSATALYRHMPATMEDIFMLTHQNALAIISAVSLPVFITDANKESIAMPVLLKKAMTVVEQGSFLSDGDSSSIKTQCIGITYAKDAITALYNLPLRNHSAVLSVRYNANLQECSLEVQFLGEARERWEQVALLAELSVDLSRCVLVEPVNLNTTSGRVSWRWSFRSLNEFDTLAHYIKVMINISYGSSVTKNDLVSLASPQILKTILPAVQNRYAQKYQSAHYISYWIGILNDDNDDIVLH